MQMKSNTVEENALSDKICSSPIMHVEEERKLFQELDEIRTDLIGPDRTFWFTNEGLAVLRSILNSKTSARDRRVARFIQIRDRIFLGSARFVRHHVRKNFRHVLSPEEHLQEGMIGMLDSVLRFDSARGVRFMTFAQWQVRASIQRFREDMGQFLRIPGRVVNVHRFLRTYEGDKTSAEEIHKALKAKFTFVIPLRTVQDAMVNLVAYSTPPYTGDPGEEPDSIYETIGDFEDPIEAREHERLSQLIQKLPPREQRVLRLHFGFEGDSVTLADIGRELSLSRERIRQIQVSGLRNLRNLIEQDEEASESVPYRNNSEKESCHDAIQRRHPNRTDRGRVPGGRVPSLLGVRRPEPAEVG